VVDSSTFLTGFFFFFFFSASPDFAGATPNSAKADSMSYCSFCFFCFFESFLDYYF
jgi:hypothetical protein